MFLMLQQYANLVELRHPLIAAMHGFVTLLAMKVVYCSTEVWVSFWCVGLRNSNQETSAYLRFTCYDSCQIKSKHAAIARLTVFN